GRRQEQVVSDLQLRIVRHALVPRKFGLRKQVAALDANDLPRCNRHVGEKTTADDSALPNGGLRRPVGGIDHDAPRARCGDTAYRKPRTKSRHYRSRTFHPSPPPLPRRPAFRHLPRTFTGGVQTARCIFKAGRKTGAFRLKWRAGATLRTRVGFGMLPCWTV